MLVRANACAQQGSYGKGSASCSRILEGVMKKIIVAVGSVVILLAIIFAVPLGKTADFLRIHIRANSDAAADQSVKYKVKAAVVEYLTPYVADVKSKEDAIAVITVELKNIEAIADRVLAENGFEYRSKAKVKSENFPDRTYNGVTLSAGVYDALILELGKADGANWWCVVYPPLCFVGGESNGTNQITYRSKILEIIAEWQSKHK